MISPFRTHGSIQEPSLGKLYGKTTHCVMTVITMARNQLALTIAPREEYTLDIQDGDIPPGPRYTASGFQTLEARADFAADKLQAYNITPQKILALTYPEDDLPKVIMGDTAVERKKSIVKLLPAVVHATWCRLFMNNIRFRNDCYRIFDGGYRNLGSSLPRDHF